MESADKIRNFRDLKVWELAMTIGEDVYSFTKSFPSDEKFGLISQMRRCSVSIASNIAEGFNRRHNAEYRQFLYVALGSCSELETQVELSRRVGYLDESIAKAILEKTDHESRMLRNLVKKL